MNQSVNIYRIKLNKLHSHTRKPTRHKWALFHMKNRRHFDF